MTRKTPRLQVNPIALSVLAAGLLAWASILIVFAVLGRDRIVPHFFDNLGIEHFVAFYALAFLAAASVPTLRLRWLMIALILLAGSVETARGLLGHPWDAVLLDFACNVAGAFCALAPVYLAHHRQAFLSDAEDEAARAGKPPSRPARVR